MVIMVFDIEDTECLNSNTTCSFSIANGYCLTVIGILGFLMSCFTLYCLTFHVKLPYRQNMFIINVSVSDVLVAVFGVIRGLGILSPHYMGADDDGQSNWWCKAYALAGNSLWVSTMPVLVPLTIDRFVAVNFPLQYPSVMTGRNCKAMICLNWFPVMVLFVYDCISYGTGNIEVGYQRNYHRCVIEANRPWKPVIFLVIPFIAIVVMYTGMLCFMHKMNIETKKLMIMSTAIIGTGLLGYTPETLMITFKVQMSYEVAQITTVTLYYLNSIWNPIIYFCTNRYTRHDLAATALGGSIVRCIPCIKEETVLRERSTTQTSEPQSHYSAL